MTSTCSVSMWPDCIELMCWYILNCSILFWPDLLCIGFHRVEGCCGRMSGLWLLRMDYSIGELLALRRHWCQRLLGMLLWKVSRAGDRSLPWENLTAFIWATSRLLRLVTCRENCFVCLKSLLISESRGSKSKRASFKVPSCHQFPSHTSFDWHSIFCKEMREHTTSFIWVTSEYLQLSSEDFLVAANLAYWMWSKVKSDATVK